MLTVIVILCALIWVPIIFHQISHRGFLVLLIWLFVAPIVTNIANGQENPFFQMPQTVQVRTRKAPPGIAYKTKPTTITLQNILEPTRTLFGAFLVVFLLSVPITKKHLIPLDKTEIWMSFFSLILVASVLLQSTRLAFGLRVAGDGLILPFLGYYIARRLVTTEDRFGQLTQVLGYLGFYVIIICLIERLIQSQLLYRLRGPFPFPDAMYMVLTVALCAVLLKEKRTLPPIVRRFVLYLSPAVILLTWQRGNWVGFLSAAWIFLFLGYFLIKRSQKMARIGLALLSPLIVVVALAAAPEKIVERGANPVTVNWRLARWEVAIKEGIKNPIFGIGLNNLRDVFGREMKNYTSAHNSFVTLFAENGIIGLLTYLAIVASIIRMGFRVYRMGPQSRDRWRGIGVIAVLTAYLVPGLFANTLYGGLRNVYVYAFLGGIAGLYTRHPSSVNDNDDVKQNTSVSKRSLTPARV